MILLAGLATDARVREVAQRWQSLTDAEKEDTSLERICCGVEIDSGKFIGEVAATGWDLGIDIGTLIGGMAGTIEWHRDLQLLWYWDEEYSGTRQAIGGQLPLLRQELALSQARFAKLFLTTARTVRRWESRETFPTEHQQWFGYILMRSAARHGIRKFVRRFIAGKRRLSRPGRPSPRTAAESANKINT